MNDIHIRKLTKEDAKSYHTVRLNMVHETPAAFGETYEEVLGQDLDFCRNRIEDSPVIGAFLEENLIGTAGYFVRKKVKCKHKAYLWGVYVEPEYRGMNISYDIVLAVLKDLPKEIEMIQLDVLKKTVPAYKTYLKIGFKDWGFEEKAVKMNGQYYDQVHMVKFLK